MVFHTEPDVRKHGFFKVETVTPKQPRASKASKVQVEIIYENGERKRKKCHIDGNTVEIIPGSKGRGLIGWKPTFTNRCLILEKKGLIFKNLKQRLVVKDGAEKCIDFSQNQIDVPSLTKKDVQKYFEASCLKAAGLSMQKPQNTILLFGILALQIASLIATFYMMRGGF